jgi:hypothetical protein
MHPKPEKAQGRGEAAEKTDSVQRRGHGLGLEARVTSPTWEVGFVGVMQDFTPGEVILLLSERIAPGTHVTIRVSTACFHGEILFCNPEGSVWETHVSFDDVDATGLRRTPRFPVRIPARAFIRGHEGPIEGWILDVSGEGLGMELPKPVPVHSNIAVQSEESMALGEVRHCRELSSGRFRVGVSFHHIMGKDPEDERVLSQSGWMSKLGVRLGRKK